jgi:NAD(P)-dependent dehydrogenase (short-subunit alcohol dehydrogenase family)
VIEAQAVKDGCGSAPGRRSAVLVTGASSGIGRATALRLARHGTLVFAGVRRPDDAEALERDGDPGLKTMFLDVTDPESILRARARIEMQRGARLDGIVNNAGIALAGPLELLPPAELRRLFDVNFFGTLAVVQAFLPLLRETHGRIVNVSSIGGRLSLPFLGAYTSSKFALEAASDALRVELRSFGIAVSVIEPGAVRTPIWERSAQASLHVLDNLPAAARRVYEAPVRSMVRAAERMGREGIAAERVALAIERALYAKRPRARYVVGFDARIRVLVALLPEALRDRILISARARRASRARGPTRRRPER